MIQLIAEDGAPRLDRFLADRFPEIPRARWDVHVRTGEIKVNGVAVTKGGVKLRPGDLVETELPVIAVPLRTWTPRTSTCPPFSKTPTCGSWTNPPAWSSILAPATPGAPS